jgi:hypothetical protein
MVEHASVLKADLWPVREQDWACLLVACVFNAFSSAGWNALDTLSSESFPLQIRTTSLGILR